MNIPSISDGDKEQSRILDEATEWQLKRELFN